MIDHNSPNNLSKERIINKKRCFYCFTNYKCVFTDRMYIHSMSCLHSARTSWESVLNRPMLSNFMITFFISISICFSLQKAEWQQHSETPENTNSKQCTSFSNSMRISNVLKMLQSVDFEVFGRVQGKQLIKLF